MRLFRRLALVIALIVAVVCVVLLLNFTAPNPTGRRYSSTSPLTSGSAQAIGLSAEQILSQDLRTPRNDDPDQRQCFCNNSNRTPSECNVCVTSDPSISTYRRPDFVSANFIAESKNRQNLLYTYNDQVDQITDYVTEARLLHRPLWLYTRVNTLLAPQFYTLVEFDRRRRGRLLHGTRLRRSSRSSCVERAGHRAGSSRHYRNLGDRRSQIIRCAAPAQSSRRQRQSRHCRGFPENGEGSSAAQDRH